MILSDLALQLFQGDINLKSWLLINLFKINFNPPHKLNKQVAQGRIDLTLNFNFSGILVINNGTCNAINISKSDRFGLLS